MKAFKSLTVVLLALTFVIGCSKQKDRGGDVRTGGRGEVSAAIIPPSGGGGGTGSGFQVQYGSVSASAAATEALLSATMTPSQYRLPFQGIAMAGDIRLQGVTDIRRASGTINIDPSSEFALFVIDDMTYTDHKPAITIGFKQGTFGASISGGTYNSRRARVELRDNCGTITLDGSYTDQEYSGTVTFQNTASCRGAGGTLGSFRVPTCGFFHCQ